MIRRVTSTEDFTVVYNSFKEIAKTIPVRHAGFPYDADILFAAFNNQNILVNSCVLVANFDTPETVDAISWFIISRDWRINKVVAQSYMWVSSNKKCGVAVFNEAINILKRKKVDIINVGFLNNSPRQNDIISLLKKKGFFFEDQSWSTVVNNGL